MVSADTNLKKAMKNYTKVVLQYLIDNAPEYYNLSDLISRYIPGLVIFKEREEEVPIYQLPEAKLFKKEMKAHSVVGKHLDVSVGTWIGASLIDAWRVFREFMQSLIKIQKDLIYDVKAFEKVFKDMMSFFKSDTITIRFVAMLENFDFFKNTKITLQNGWRLERISKMQVDDLVGISGFDKYFPHHVYETRYALINEFKFKKTNVNDDERNRKKALDLFMQINDEIEIIMMAFRLIKRGRITRTTGRQVIGWHPFGVRTTSRNLGVPLEPGTRYTFTEEGVDKLNEMLDLLSYVKSDDVIQIPLRRLRYATERRHAIPEDRILDGMIAFDSLFGADREMSYRLSLRIAMFLGKSSEERMLLKKDLGSAYNLRSKIIHGNKPKQVRKALKDWGLSSTQKTIKLNDLLGQAADKIEDLLRRTLVKYLKELKTGKTNDIMMNALNDMILNDASMPLLDTEKIPDSSIIDYLISLGGTPKKIVELLIERAICKEEK